MVLKFTQQNLILVGPTGAGKSAIGRQLADTLELEFFDSDEEIENRTGADIAWIFDVEGEEKFRERETAIIEELTGHSGIVLATGGGAILREENRKMMRSRGVVVHLQVSIEEQFMRTQRDSRNRRPLLRSDDRKEVLIEMARKRDELYRSVADVQFDTNEKTVKAVVQDIISWLSAHDKTIND